MGLRQQACIAPILAVSLHRKGNETLPGCYPREIALQIGACKTSLWALSSTGTGHIVTLPSNLQCLNFVCEFNQGVQQLANWPACLTFACEVNRNVEM